MPTREGKPNNGVSTAMIVGWSFARLVSIKFLNLVWFTKLCNRRVYNVVNTTKIVI